MYHCNEQSSDSYHTVELFVQHEQNTVNKKMGNQQRSLIFQVYVRFYLFNRASISCGKDVRQLKDCNISVIYSIVTIATVSRCSSLNLTVFHIPLWAPNIKTFQLRQRSNTAVPVSTRFTTRVSVATEVPQPMTTNKEDPGVLSISFSQDGCRGSHLAGGSRHL